MKTKIFLCILSAFAVTNCQVHRNIQKSSLKVDSTGSSSGKLVNTAVLHEHTLDSSRFASFADMRSGWQRQTLNIQFASALSIPQRSSNDTTAALVDAANSYLAGLPPSMLNRVTGLTFTVENGKEEKQSSSTAHQNSERLTDGRDSLNSSQQQSAHLVKNEQAKEREVTKKGFIVPWYVWGIGVLLLAGFVVGWGYFKGWWGILGIVKKKRSSNPQQ